MFRHSIQFLALGAVAAVAAASEAAAGSCCACAPACGQFYIVNQGPVYSGPGIVVTPGYFELDRVRAVYPYIGSTYWYQPYDGPRYRSVHRVRGPRRMVMPPLDPIDK